MPSTQEQARCYQGTQRTSGDKSVGFNKYSWTRDTERPSRKAVPVSTPTTSTGERLSLLLSILVLKNPCQSGEQKKSQCTLMCICWIASEVTCLSGPLPGRQCSLGILREELAANPLLWLAEGAGTWHPQSAGRALWLSCDFRGHHPEKGLLGAASLFTFRC